MQLAESVLIVNDDIKNCSVWRDSLEAQGYPVTCSNSPNEAVRLFSDHTFGLVLINLKQYGRMSGIELVEWIKDNHPSTDMIVLTSYADLNTSLEALRMGAFDYLVTPVNIIEVVSRVNRCMSERRSSAERLAVIEQIESKLNQLKNQLLPDSDGHHSHNHILETENVIVDRRKRLVVQEGEPIQLSPIEFDMLDYLVSNADRVVSASELIRAVQGYTMNERDARPIVRVNIRRLRQKIERDTSNPQHIVTVRSRGYRFAA